MKGYWGAGDRKKRFRLGLCIFGTMLVLLLIGTVALAEEDVNPPVISSAFPVDNVNNATPQIGAVVIDDGAVVAENCTVSLDDGPAATGLVYDNGTQTLSINWPIPLPDGTHTVKLEAKDAAGNIASYNWSFVVDTLAPVITKGIPDEGTVQQLKTNALPEYDVICNDASGIKAARFFVNDVLSTKSVLLDWGDEKLALLSSQSAKDGTYNFRVELEDFAGNITIRTWQVQVCGVPNITSCSPSGTITSTTPTIKAYITDYCGVDTNNMFMTIDGGPEINVTAFYSTKTKYLTYLVKSPLAPAKHTVMLRVRCINGHETTKSWTFSYDSGAPQMTKAVLLNYPENTGTRTEFALTEGVKLPKGNNLLFTFLVSEALSQMRVTLDGSLVTAKNSYEYGTSLYSRTWVLDERILNDGLHNINIQMTDSSGNKGVYNLNFTVCDVPEISDENPSNLAKLPLPTLSSGVITDRRWEAVVTTTKPNISMKITDGNDTLQSSAISFKIDGQDQPFTYDPATGVLTYQPEENLENEAVHVITVNASDAAGNNVSAEWKFYINTYPNMAWSTDQTCVNCHTNNRKIHLPTTAEDAAKYGTNCRNCHGDNSLQTLEQRCIACHKNLWHQSIYPQGEFHEVSYKDQTGIPTTTLDTIHRSDSGGCEVCHAKSINREHQRPGRTDVDGNPITCDTCHLSTKVNVIQTITDGKTGCVNCHNTPETNHESVHISKMDANCTKECHKASLVQEHTANPKTQTKSLTCGTCHESKEPKVVAAIANNKIECGYCHNQAHNMIWAANAVNDVPLMAGLKWTSPMAASLWKGEVPPEMEKGYVVLSNSTTQLAGEEVLAYYKDTLTGKGWLSEGSEPTDMNNFTVAFTKGASKIFLQFVPVTGKTGEIHRIKLVYN